MKQTLFSLVLIIFLLPQLSLARGVDRDDLDDDIVEDMYMPVLFAISYGDLVPDFGDPRGGGTRSHEGQDMRASKGTPIVSPTEAIVISTGEGSSAGKYVYTANPGGETFRYMHLDYIADLDRGDKLDPGNFIGTVGDTGNAPSGVHHLHFEIRDDRNRPLDPYDRLTKDFSLRKQVSYLRDIFRDIRNDEEYASFLVTEYPEVFRTAYREEWDLPRAIDRELEDLDIEAELDAEQGLKTVLESIPKVLQPGIEEGDAGVLVSLLQLYLIYTTDTPERDRLAAAGPTGYFGPITTATVEAYQEEQELPETGQYDSRTRGEMMERLFVLNLDPELAK